MIMKLRQCQTIDEEYQKHTTIPLHQGDDYDDNHKKQISSGPNYAPDFWVNFQQHIRMRVLLRERNYNVCQRM